MLIIDPKRGVAFARGEGTSKFWMPSGLSDVPGQWVTVNPRRVDHKRKAKDRAHRKAVKRQKAAQRSARG